MDSFWARNFAFWIFIKKILLMVGLIALYDYFYIGLAIMASSCLGFALMLYFFRPYTLPTMNDYHIISEGISIMCFVLFY